MREIKLWDKSFIQLSIMYNGKKKIYEISIYH
jgi:hypothetical protein